MHSRTLSKHSKVVHIVETMHECGLSVANFHSAVHFAHYSVCKLHVDPQAWLAIKVSAFLLAARLGRGGWADELLGYKTTIILLCMARNFCIGSETRRFLTFTRL